MDEGISPLLEKFSGFLRFIEHWGKMQQINALIGKLRRANIHSVDEIKIVQNEELSEVNPIESMEINGETSDGYHTFNELYEFRKLYNAALFNKWAEQNLYSVHKSWKHHDGELCFGGGWFIVSALLPTGQISNHYKAQDWELFEIPSSEKALFEYDGHSAQDVTTRLRDYILSPKDVIDL